MAATDFTNLFSVLSWLAYGPGCGLIAYWLMGKLPWRPAQSELRRFISIGVTIALAILAWLILVAAGAMPAPFGFWPWVVKLFGVGGTAYLMNQGLHGLTNLREQDKATRKTIAVLDELTNSSDPDYRGCDCAK